ncbi:hypothetical protein BGZ99_004700 [Dissophora globulifera]|uniref:BTB domain-containing protein n=1 Tax=Dissophora globulifera TaxID=979702 RepID=A0A9P6RH64_9FUNG|nr:hypothetical protein BGZ99_004700 [Dissophora globulifera]
MSTHHASLSSAHAPANKAHSLPPTALMLDDVNHKDLDGRTPLHRAVATNDLDSVAALLRHPKLDVNAKDLESGWTALHRALYLGHLRIAMLLIQHKDINLTIEAARGPCAADALYTWGSNSNFTLGHNDGDDRKIPELVKFPYQTSTITFPRAKSAKPTLYQLSMSKFHTAIATSESGFTAKMWGFGTNGRLGSDRKMQLRPAPVTGISGNVTITALGRDHSVFVTAKGEVYTLGNNKYGQLGYSSEIPKNGQDPIQYSPKRVVLSIAKLAITGAAASRWHTVVHTATELFTFGFNYGQLGYERKGDIQLGPRKVASVPQGLIMQVAASDAATACLMSTNDVFVFYKYAYHKVSFSLFPYPDWFANTMMSSVLNENRPRKIACSENKFGMMTGWGDVHVWSYPEVDADITLGSLPANHSIPFSSISLPDKPRRVWTYGGERTHVIDFALGQNGSIIMLTQGGHVYIGTNKGNSYGRNVKWQRIPHLDRIVQVYGNPSGAWAAMRSESALTPVVVRPGCIASDLEQSLSQFHLYRNNEKNNGTSLEIKVSDDDDDDEDYKVVADPWRIDIQGWQDIEKSWDYDVVPLLDLSTQQGDTLTGRSVSGSHLFDVELQAGKRVLGGHRIILAARSSVFRRAFVDTPRSRTNVGSLVTITPNTTEGSAGRILYTVLLKVEFATAVLLLQFLYSDRFDPFWDALDLPKSYKQYAQKVRQELYHLALELSLPTLQAALQYSFTHVCSASLSKNMEQVIQDTLRFKGLADVRLLLRDGASLDLHQLVLGHRSPFFNAMFVRTDDWIRARQGPRCLPGLDTDGQNRLLEIDLKHFDAEAMTLAMKYIYTDCGSEMFNDIEKDDMDDLIQVVVNVLQLADELLVDRLKEICENVLGEQVRAKTVVTFLEIALMYAADSLKATCIDYLCHNIEMALDQRWLEGVDDDIVALVEEALREKQDKFMPFIRSGGYLPDPATVDAMQEVIKVRGFRFFKPWGLHHFQSDVPKVSRPIHGRDPEHGHASTIRAAPHTSVPELATTPPVSTLLSSSPLRQAPLEHRPSQGQRLELSGSASHANSAMEWPTLSDAPHLEPRDNPLPQRKTSWGHTASVDSPQLGRDGQEGVSGDSVIAKPSLRDIVEAEQRQGQTNIAKVPSMTPPTATVSSKASKLSQKERRKLLLQQQQVSPSSPDLSQPAPTPAPPTAWAKIPSANDLGTVIMDGSGVLRRHSSSAEVMAGTPPMVSPSLLDIQQSELALFRAQPKEVPRVAIATSKPVKEKTMRPGGTERTFSEAPWRLDAIPEPLRAVTRHQSQMYPKLESSSGHPHHAGSGAGTSSSPLPGPSQSSSNGVSSEAALSSGVAGATTNGHTALTGGTPALTATALSGSGMSVLTGSASSASSSLSSFAIIQNQQLRNRNMLLRARHHKKSLYQIQIEEQALGQMRSMQLERVRARAAEGTGEWFTCTIGVGADRY